MAYRLKALLLSLLVLASPLAFATNYPISAGASLATAQSTINTAAAAAGANTVTFAAGTYSWAWSSSGTALNIPCPAGSLVITGPTTNYDQPGVQNAWAASPTATITNTTTGASYQLIGTPGGCQNPITIQYLEINGNHPTTGGGSIYMNSGSAGYSAATGPVTIQYNWLHGNQEVTPYVCGYYPSQYVCYDDERATLIDMEGGAGSGSIGPVITAIIQHNILGAAVAGNPSAGDCGNVMSFVGTCTAQGNPAHYNPANCTPGTSGCDSCVYVGADTTGGFCAALGVHVSTYNTLFNNNTIPQQEQGTKWFESGAYPNYLFETNDVFEYNDFSNIVRIMTEDQAGPTTYIGGTSPGNCPSQPNSACQQRKYNSNHDQVTPSGNGWGFSMPHTAYEDDTDNVMISNTVNGGGTAGPGNFEWWASAPSQNSYNLEQGYVGCGTDFGYGVSPSTAISYNIFQFYNANSSNCSATNSSSQTIVGAQNEFPCCNAGYIPSTSYPAFVGNTYASSTSALTSTAPTFSPNGGSFSGTVAVTLSDTGNVSGAGPRGNTNLWCTTDGSTPAPKSGTSAFYPSGYVLTLMTTTTLKCVGMWGAQNQPAPAGTSGVTSYPSGYGYVPSAVVSATFTGGGTPTAATPVFSPTSQNFTSSQTFTIASSTPSSSIYYCPGSCTPTTSSTLYTGAITTSSTQTYNAIAVASGYNNSSIGTATYTLVSPGAAATPTFSPAAQTFTGTIVVTLATTTPSATIYYCPGSCTPTTSSTVYTGPLTLSSTTTINAVAIAPGYTLSGVGTATYTYQLFLGNNQITGNVQTYGNGMIMTYAVTGSNPSGYTVSSCVINQSNGTVTNGAHTDCLVIAAPTPTTEAATALCHGTYTNTSGTGTTATISMSGCGTLPPNTPYWVATNTNDTLNPSSYGGWNCGSTCGNTAPTVNNGTYSGFFVGPVTYGTYTSLPSALTQGADQFTQYLVLANASTPVAATPVISPAGGAQTSPVTVSITDTTPSSTIYYTTNGATPTTSSTQYTGTFTVSTSKQVQAIAVASGYTTSPVASQSYSFSGATISSLKLFINPATSCPNCVLPGGTAQFYVNITYSDGTVTTNNVVGTADSKGNAITSITSSNTSIGTISNSLLFTGVSCPAGQLGCTTMITATVTGGMTVTWLESLAATTTTGIAGGTYVAPPPVSVVLPNIQASSTDWDVCVIGNCPSGGTPGGTGTPTAYTSPTFGISSPSLSGSAILLSQTANANSTNALWSNNYHTAACDACSALDMVASVYLGTTAASNYEYDDYIFSNRFSRNIMAGHQYNVTLGLWQVWNGASLSWENTSVTHFVSNSSWHSLEFSDTTNGTSVTFGSIIIDGTVYPVNLTYTTAVLPSSFASTVGCQFQLDQNTVSGSQTVQEYADNITCSASS